ncbi:hypothetical protein F1880_000909 [Penicillium rolfsii]|nr:hypothetical protein F1880_000909 [Penicillium rolfsii]
MKFSQLTLSLAMTSMVSAAAIPALPGTDGVVGGLKGATEGVIAGIAGGHVKRETPILDAVEEMSHGSIDGINHITQNTLAGQKRQELSVDAIKHDLESGLAGHPKRQLEVVQPVTEGVASSLNGGTGIVGSAVGTAESTSQGAVGTVESTVAGAGHLKRQLEVAQPVTESVSSSLNGGTGIIGSAAGTAESTGQGAVGTAESTVAGLASAAKRQLGNLPATASQTGTDLMAGLSGNPSGIYGALANLQMLVNAGEISPSDISNMPAAVQRVIANLAVA